MKILVVMRHAGYVRNFESTLRLLCERGHTVRLSFQIATHALFDSRDVAQELSDEFPLFSRGVLTARDDTWGMAAQDLRLGLDYLRYLTPAYRNAPKLVARARREASEAFVERVERRPFTSPAGRAALAWWLRRQHRAIPTDPRIDAMLEAYRPDVLAVTPLIEPGAPQAEFLRSARAMGVRTALCVASWDNLTNKGLIHGPVDLVTVWNEMMKQEAVALHGVPPGRVAVTGAQPFDHWFDWQPSTTYAEFCAQTGLPFDRPYVLYLCSSRFIAPHEAPFVRSWIGAIRASSSPRLREAGILIRPHPQNLDQWQGVDLSDLGPVALWPPAVQAPADAQGRRDYFDSIHHSAAVVGINTTAEIESAIIGRSVFTVTAPEFSETQGGTLHFEHLRQVNGGLLHVAPDLAGHVGQLEAALSHPSADDERCRRFVEAFVRPHGLNVPATPRLVDALEALAATPAPEPGRAPVWAPLVRPSLLRQGARLQRAAVLHAEAKATRQAAKRRRQKEAETADQLAVPPPKAPLPIRHWKDLARAYRELDYKQRVFFGRTTIDEMPGELLPQIAEHVQPERLDYPHAEILLRVTSKAERSRLNACVKEPFTIDWIRRWMQPGDVFYDIGSNVGVYSLVAAKGPGGGARVFSFDPSYGNIASLGANILLNGVVDQVTPLPVALSDTTGRNVFALRSLEAGAARHVLGDAPPEEGPALYRQPVLTFRLDDLVQLADLPLPNHIKLDVDGGELAVLQGAARTLESPSLRSVLIEVSTSMSEAITTALAAHGLQLDSKVNVQSRAGEYLVWYGLFTRDVRGGPSPDGLAVEVVSR
jgi:FkbM family methyltransferase